MDSHGLIGINVSDNPLVSDDTNAAEEKRRQQRSYNHINRQ
jgi:hypothetical protein